MKQKLTPREKKIIQILTKSSPKKPITISQIAKELNLSSRTVLREIPSIKFWLTENGFKFVKKTGVGLILDEDLNNKDLILELLEIENIKKEYSKEERRQIILSELLLAKGPLKSFYFTDMLKVSEGTISNDLDKVENWLKEFNIHVIRKQGLGIYIEGKENNYREAIINILYNNLEEDRLIELLRGTIPSPKNKKAKLAVENRLLNFVDKSIINKIDELLFKLDENLLEELADNSYVGLIIHISLAIQRIKNNENIIIDKDVLEELENFSEFKIAKQISKEIEKVFDVKIPKDEIGYITMHLKGAKLRLNKLNKELDIDLDNLNIKHVANYIIKKIEDKFNVDIHSSGSLIKDLTNHLGPAISRLTMKLDIRNPLLDNIKESCSEIYLECEKACDILKDITKIQHIPESEIGYITMHIVAAMEKNVQNEKVKVVIACPTGMGTSKLLATNIKNEFENVEVKEIISAINIDENELKKNQIDLIISTVDLDSDYKYVTVSPMLSKENTEVLKDLIYKILKKKKYERMINGNKNYKANIEKANTTKIKEKRIEKSNIETITKLGTDVMDLLSDIKLYQLDSVASLDELIKKASSMFAKNSKEAISIEEGLIKRESLSSTFVKDFNAMFLHCKNVNVYKCKFGLIRLKEMLNDNGKEIKLGIVLLAPLNASATQLKIIGEISSAFVEKDDFVKALNNGDEKQIIIKVEEILSEFYTKILKNIMEEEKNDKR